MLPSFSVMRNSEQLISIYLFHATHIALIVLFTGWWVLGYTFRFCSEAIEFHTPHHLCHLSLCLSLALWWSFGDEGTRTAHLVQYEVGHGVFFLCSLNLSKWIFDHCGVLGSDAFIELALVDLKVLFLSCNSYRHSLAPVEWPNIGQDK